MWINDSGFLINEYEFRTFADAIEFINKVTPIAFSAELNSLWKQKLQVAKIKIKLEDQSDNKDLTIKIDNIYFQIK